MHPSDLTVRTIAYLRTLNTPEADELADEHLASDWHLNPICRNCKHINLRTGWCRKKSQIVDKFKKQPCFQGHPEYLQLTAPLDQ